MCRYGRRKGWYLYKEAVYVQIRKEKGLVSVQRGGLCADTEGERAGICTKRRFMCKYGRRKGWYLYEEAVYVQIRKEEGLLSVQRGGLCADTEGGRVVICTKRRFMCRYGRRKGCYLYKKAVYVQIWKEEECVSVQRGGLCADMEGGRVCICTEVFTVHLLRLLRSVSDMFDHFRVLTMPHFFRIYRGINKETSVNAEANERVNE